MPLVPIWMFEEIVVWPRRLGSTYHYLFWYSDCDLVIGINVINCKHFVSDRQTLMGSTHRINVTKYFQDLRMENNGKSSLSCQSLDLFTFCYVRVGWTTSVVTNLICNGLIKFGEIKQVTNFCLLFCLGLENVQKPPPFLLPVSTINQDCNVDNNIL